MEFLDLSITSRNGLNNFNFRKMNLHQPTLQTTDKALLIQYLQVLPERRSGRVDSLRQNLRFSMHKSGAERVAQGEAGNLLSSMGQARDGVKYV